MGSELERQPLTLILGASKGMVSRLAPRTRILAGVLVFLACLALDAGTGAGLAALAVTTLTWLVAARAPARLVGKVLLFGMVMLGPVLVLTPFVDAPSGTPGGLAVTFAVFAKGMATLVVATVTASTLTLAQAHEGLATLPLPRLVTAIVLQIFFQAGLLGRETTRMARAMILRRSGGGTWQGIAVLAGVSTVWITRLIVKVERIAKAMEVRGFDGMERLHPTSAAGTADAVALALTGAWLVAVIAARTGALG